MTLNNLPGSKTNYRYHRVVAKDNFTEPRITLGFDVCTEPMEPQHMMSLIPL